MAVIWPDQESFSQKHIGTQNSWVWKAPLWYLAINSESAAINSGSSANSHSVYSCFIPDKQDIWSLKAGLQHSTVCEELCFSLLGPYSPGNSRQLYKVNVVIRNVVSSQFLHFFFFNLPINGPNILCKWPFALPVEPEHHRRHPARAPIIAQCMCNTRF